MAFTKEQHREMMQAKWKDPIFLHKFYIGSLRSKVAKLTKVVKDMSELAPSNVIASAMLESAKEQLSYAQSQLEMRINALEELKANA